MNFYNLAQIGAIKADPNGTMTDPATGLKYSPVGGANAATIATNPAAYKYLGNAGLQSAQTEQQNFGRAMTLNPDLIKQSNDVKQGVYSAATTAEGNLSTLDEQTNALMSQKGGPLQQGALAGVAAPSVAFFNSLVTDAGRPDLVIQGLGDTQIANKLQSAQAFTQAAAGGERAYSALEAAMGVNPGTHLDKNAAVTLMSQMRMQAVKDIDRRNYFDEFSKASPNYLAPDVNSAFDADHPAAQYNAERSLFGNLIGGQGYQAMRADLQTPGSPEYQRAVKTLDALGEQHGVHHFSRYITGAPE